jgi:hypothetical protein
VPIEIHVDPGLYVLLAFMSWRGYNYYLFRARGDVVRTNFATDLVPLQHVMNVYFADIAFDTILDYLPSPASVG